MVVFLTVTSFPSESGSGLGVALIMYSWVPLLTTELLRGPKKMKKMDVHDLSHTFCSLSIRIVVKCVV